MIKILKKIFDIFIIIIIVILAAYYLLRATDKVEIFSIMTGSMEDKIHAGDYILVLKKDSYEVGDVVTFEKDYYRITHRIIKEEENSFITKGDANNVEDGRISKDSIIGKVILSGGILNIIIRYKYVIAGIILSLYLLNWIICDLVKNRKEKEEEETNEEAIEDSNEVEEEETIEDSKEEELAEETKEESDEVENEEVVEEEKKTTSKKVKDKEE